MNNTFAFCLDPEPVEGLKITLRRAERQILSKPAIGGRVEARRADIVRLLVQYPGWLGGQARRNEYEHSKIIYEKWSLNVLELRTQACCVPSRRVAARNVRDREIMRVLPLSLW